MVLHEERPVVEKEVVPVERVQLPSKETVTGEESTPQRRGPQGADRYRGTRAGPRPLNLPAERGLRDREAPYQHAVEHRISNNVGTTMAEVTTEQSKASAPGASSSGTAVSKRGAGGLQTEKGQTTIADPVVTKVAGIAAREVAGVHQLGGGVARASGGSRTAPARWRR